MRIDVGGSCEGMFVRYLATQTSPQLSRIPLEPSISCHLHLLKFFLYKVARVLYIQNVKRFILP